MPGWDWFRRSVKLLGSGLVSLLYPPVCPLCDELFDDQSDWFCPACLAGLAGTTRNACPRCARVVGPYQEVSGGCPACRSKKFHFSGAVRLGHYEGRLREAVLRCKHHSGEPLAELLGKVFAGTRRDQLLASGADAIVPVPLHWRRKWRRGYNQSEAIACGLASVLNLPVRSGWLRRVRNTPTQHLIPPAQRKDTMAGAFRGDPAAEGRTVLLVDDVMTTGGTCDEAASALLRAGADAVIAAVLARAS